MKIQTTVEITPQEARELFGIPDNAYTTFFQPGNLAPEDWREYQKLFNPLNWITQGNIK